MIKKLLLVVLVIVGYIVYARFVLSPHLYKNFSLIDDGQQIKYGEFLRKCFTEDGCGGFKSEILAKSVGTSRMGHWLIQGAIYQGSLVNARYQHELRIYGVGLILVSLLVLSAQSAGSNAIATILGATVFVTNYSFSENIIRLGPNEPYLVVFLGIFSLLFLNIQRLYNRQKLLAIFTLVTTLIYFLLIKEVSIAILPTIIIIGMLFPKTLSKKVLIAVVIISGVVYVLAKYLLRGLVPEADLTYVNEYKLDLLFIFQNTKHYLVLLSNSLSPFFKIFIIIAPFILVYKKFRQKILDKHLVYWLLVFVSFTAIMFPWGYVLDRYLLPSIYAFSIIVSIMISKIIEQLENITTFSERGKLIFQSVVIVALSNMYFRGAPINIAKTINYRDWYIAFTQFEADQVSSIVKYKEDVVYINAKDIIANSEVVYEIPLHLKYFYDGKPKIERIGETLPREGCVFTTTSLKPVIDIDTLSKLEYSLVDSKEYSVSQIDTLAFRDSFKFRPIQTFKQPPLLKEGFSYYWEIRKL